MTKTFQLYWVREDQQGDLAEGVYATYVEAEAAIPERRQFLIDQAGEDWQKQEILDGSWSILEEDDEA